MEKRSHKTEGALTESSGQLEYAPRPAFGWRKKKQLILAACLLAMAVALVLCRNTVRSYVRWAQVLYIQRQALAYEIDPNRVVYEEDQSRGAAPANESDYHDETRANGHRVTLWDPMVWDPIARLYLVGIPSRNQALLFLHERTTQSGQHLLLGVHASVEPPNQYHAAESLRFHLEEIIPGDWHHPLMARNGLNTPVLGLDFTDRTKPLRLFGGQVDPNDESHFTIRYRLGDEEGIIDGYEGDRTEDAQGIPTPGLRLEVRKEKTGSPK